MTEHLIAFEGRVIPENYNFSSPGLHVVRWRDTETEAVVFFTFEFHESRVKVTCETDHALGGDWTEMYRRAWDWCTAFVDLNCFAKGWHMMVVFDSMSTNGGERELLRTGRRRLGDYCTAYQPDEGIDEILLVVMREPALRVALNDLNASLGTHVYSHVHQARAVDAIRNMIAGPGVKASKGWRLLRETLRADEAYVRLITETSSGPRHAEHMDLSSEIIGEISNRAWTIMNRFLTYRLRGNQPLPEDEFPELRG